MLRVYLLIFFLTSCNLQPVYSNNYGKIISEVLPEINIEPIAGQEGYLLRNRLEEILSRHKKEEQGSKYLLNIHLHKSMSNLTQTSEGITTRYQLYMMASFSLHEMNSHNNICAGSVKMVSDYDAISNLYTQSMLEQKSSTNLINDMAQQIEIRIINCLLSKAHADKTSTN